MCEQDVVRRREEQKMQDVMILGIESSCDETSAAVVVNGRTVLSNIISSQIDIHKEYGGVVPEIASRKHVELINYVVKDALKEAGVTLEDVDAIAVTYGPGLVGALLVGLSAAKGLAYATGKPLVGVHHIEGHISANFITHPDLKPPFICLVASGGHSHIVKVKDYGQYEILGQTRDDAAGEAFDKISRALGLGYPGGPAIDKAAKQGNPYAIAFPKTTFAGSYDFSFSGIKTAVLNYLNQQEQKGLPVCVEDVCASFQQAVVDMLVSHTISAASDLGVSTVCLAGGVAANSCLRATLQAECEKKGFSVYYPKPILCTDNAAMIASAGYYEYMVGNVADLSLNAVPNLKLGAR